MKKQQLWTGVAAVSAALLTGSIPAVQASDTVEPQIMTRNATYESNSETDIRVDFTGAAPGWYYGQIWCDDVDNYYYDPPYTGEHYSAGGEGYYYDGESYGAGPWEPGWGDAQVFVFRLPTGDQAFPLGCEFLLDGPQGESWTGLGIKQRQLDVSNASARQRTVKFDLNSDAKVRVIVKNLAGNVIKRVGPVKRNTGTRYIKWNRYDVLRPGKYRLFIRAVDNPEGYWSSDYNTRDTARTRVRVR